MEHVRHHETIGTHTKEQREINKEALAKHHADFIEDRFRRLAATTPELNRGIAPLSTTALSETTRDTLISLYAA